MTAHHAAQRTRRHASITLLRRVAAVALVLSGLAVVASDTAPPPPSPAPLAAAAIAPSAERAPNFWQNATVTDLAAGGDLAALLLSLAASGSKGKHVIALSGGGYDLPQANHLNIPVSGDLLIRGQGVNVTYVNARGFQSTLLLAAAATLELHSLTLTGASGGLISFTDVSSAGADVPAYPTVYYISMEWWRGADDTDTSMAVLVPRDRCPASLRPADPTQGCYAGTLVAALLRSYQNNLFQVLSGNWSNIDFSVYAAHYPLSARYLQVRYIGSAAVSGVSTSVFYNATFRAVATLPVMRELFDWFVNRSPDFAGSDGCYSPNDWDLGYTYRGNASRSQSGQECLRWDDPSIPYNVFWPNVPGAAFTSTEANFCRNPTFYQLSPSGPWCNVFNQQTGKYEYESCGLPLCSHRSHTDAAVVAAICVPIGVVCLLAGLLSACLLRRRRKRRRATAEKPALPAAEELDAPIVVPIAVKQDQYWHAREPFQTLEELPPQSASAAADGVAEEHTTSPAVFAPVDTGVSAAPVATHASPGSNAAPAQQDERWDASFDAATVRAMLASCGPVDSVATGDLEGKYGAAWVRDNCIDTSAAIGSGTFGQVYRGLAGGRPAAYKVINSMRPLDSLLRFVRKNVLPVVLIQRARNFPTAHPHLLPLIDCVMFPPWYSLLALARDADLDAASGTTPEPSDLARRTHQRRIQQHIAATGGRSWRHDERPAASLAPSSQPDTQPRDGGARSQVGRYAPLPVFVFDGGSDDSAAGTPPASPPESPSDVGGAAAAATSGGDGDDGDGDGVWGPGRPPWAPRLARAHTWAAAGAPHARQPAPRSGGNAASGAALGPPLRPDASSEIVPALWFGNSLASVHMAVPLQSFGSQQRPSSERTAGVDRKQSLVVQVIMVMPLCELGTLSACIRGSSLLPVSCLPAELRGTVAARLSVDRTEAISEERSEAAPSFKQGDVFSIKDLPEPWQTVLRLQLCIQVVDGVMALHSCHLIHCDIKPDNIFITASDAFGPFGLCARIGDMDTCRSLLGVHEPDGAPLRREPRLPVDSFEVQSKGNILAARHTTSSTGLSSQQLEPISDPVLMDTGGLPPLAGSNLSNATRASVASLYTTCLKGTPGFLAPEMILQGKIAPTTDVFSLGVTISVVLARRHRFIPGENLHVRSVADYPETVGEEVVQMLISATQQEPAQRPPLPRVREILLSQLARLQRSALGGDECPPAAAHAASNGSVVDGTAV